MYGPSRRRPAGRRRGTPLPAAARRALGPKAPRQPLASVALLPSAPAAGRSSRRPPESRRQGRHYRRVPAFQPHSCVSRYPSPCSDYPRCRPRVSRPAQVTIQDRRRPRTRSGSIRRAAGRARGERVQRGTHCGRSTGAHSLPAVRSQPFWQLASCCPRVLLQPRSWGRFGPLPSLA